MKKYYLAYGSNLNLEQMMMRCPDAEVVGTYNLENYRLVYKGGRDEYSYLTIESCPGSIVPLGIYEVTDFDIFNLDIYEGYPDFYHKKYINLNVNGVNIKGLIYVMNPWFTYHLPSNEYIETCIRGYEDFNFNKEILDSALTNTINSKNKYLKR